jgi:hypothetical protein
VVKKAPDPGSGSAVTVHSTGTQVEATWEGPYLSLRLTFSYY